ncbi:MAG: hypothetical protein JWM10_1462 [Myxococcaceae bacterium]|nr:hypothetical protein [Myxococcaceae bacterium]
MTATALVPILPPLAAPLVTGHPPLHLLRRALIALASLLLAAAPASAQPVPPSAEVCRRVAPLVDGDNVAGSTAGLADRAHASCARQALSGERVYALHLDQPSHVALRVAADYDVAVYVRRDCADEVTELACNDDLEDARHAGVDLDLAAGTWFVFVDGFDSDSSGNYTLSVSVRPTAPRLSRAATRPPVATRAPWRPNS